MNIWPAGDIRPVSEMAVTEGKEVYNIVLIRIPQTDLIQENYAPIYFKKNINRSMYVPFFLSPWLLRSLQLRKNQFSVRWERTGFLYTLAWDLLLLKRRKRDKKKTVQLNIYKQINTWELLFDLLLKLDLYFTKSFSDHLTF